MFEVFVSFNDFYIFFQISRFLDTKTILIMTLLKMPILVTLNTGDIAYNAITYNAITYNDITYNAITYNDITYNAITYNAITYNAITYNAITYN